MVALLNSRRIVGWAIGHLRNHFLDCTLSQLARTRQLMRWVNELVMRIRIILDGCYLGEENCMCGNKVWNDN